MYYSSRRNLNSLIFPAFAFCSRAGRPRHVASSSLAKPTAKEPPEFLNCRLADFLDPGPWTLDRNRTTNQPTSTCTVQPASRQADNQQQASNGGGDLWTRPPSASARPRPLPRVGTLVVARRDDGPHSPAILPVVCDCDCDFHGPPSRECERQQKQQQHQY